jgi:ubiquinone/menaquinone biosynthesis C-methylase UbiE
LDTHHWEQYYRTGALVTGPAGRDGAYDQELRDHWIERFRPLHDGAAILDIGTGNGAVPYIARQLANELGRAWRIVGVDRAQIDPPAHVPDGATRLADIEFMAGVAAEALPFGEASFDIVTGQYALEYTELARTLGEVARVCRPGGQAVFVLHHAGSVLLHNARLSLAQAQFVLMDTKIYRKLRRVVAMENEAEPAVRKATNDLRAAIGELKLAVEKARGLSTALVLEAALDAVPKLLAVRTEMSPAEADREVGKVEGELRGMVHRLQDLLDHALDEAALRDVVEAMQGVGFESVEYRPQFHGGHHVVGWQLSAHRRT